MRIGPNDAANRSNSVEAQSEASQSSKIKSAAPVQVTPQNVLEMFFPALGVPGIIGREGGLLGTILNLAKLAAGLGGAPSATPATANPSSASTDPRSSVARTSDGKSTSGVATTADAAARSWSSSSIGPDGLRAEAGFDATARAEARARASAEGDWGKVEAEASAGAEAYVRGGATATVDANGTRANARVEAGARVYSEASVTYESQPLVMIGGREVTLNAQATGRAEAGASGSAETSVICTYNPPEALVRGKAEAFAGARASADAKIGLGPVAVRGYAEGWAGAGSAAGFEAGYRDGKVSLDYGYGGATGVGGKLGFGVDIDLSFCGPFKDVVGMLLVSELSGIASLVPGVGLIGAAGNVLASVQKGDLLGAAGALVGANPLGRLFRIGQQGNSLPSLPGLGNGMQKPGGPLVGLLGLGGGPTPKQAALLSALGGLGGDSTKGILEKLGAADGPRRGFNPDSKLEGILGNGNNAKTGDRLNLLSGEKTTEHTQTWRSETSAKEDERKSDERDATKLER